MTYVGKPVEIEGVQLVVNGITLPPERQFFFLSPLIEEKGFGIAASALFEDIEANPDPLAMLQALGLNYGDNSVSLKVNTDVGYTSAEVELEIVPEVNEKKKFKAGCLNRVARYFLPRASGKGKIKLKNTGECPIRVGSMVSNPVFKNNKNDRLQTRISHVCSVQSDSFAPDNAKPEKECQLNQNNILWVQVFCPRLTKKKFDCCAAEYTISWQ